MISSMQKNKKWLLPTIWISTIAFVGAGFVGWGSYNPTASKGSTIATVGHREVPMQGLQQEYNNIYNQYSQMFGKQFNQELADKMDLKKIAYDNIIQKYLLLNLADDIGLMATNEEIYAQLILMPSFQKDGKFDKNKYKIVLKQNRLNTKEFEEQLKIDLTLSKLQKVYVSTTNDNFVEKLNKIYFAKDKVAINIIDSSVIDINVSSENLKNYYDKNKENYKSNDQFKVNVFKVTINNNDEKKAKKDALRQFIKLKKKTASFNKTELLDENSAFLSKEEQNKIFNSKLNKVLKPIRVNDDFVIYQLVEKIKPKVLSFDTVKEKIKQDYIDFKKQYIVNNKKDKLLKNFVGKEIGYITKTQTSTIDSLNIEETKQLIQNISNSQSIVNFVKINNKTIVFKILETQLASFDEKNNEALKNSLLKIKDSITMSSLIENLKNKYTITSDFKAN